jgi:hypothetical protein
MAYFPRSGYKILAVITSKRKNIVPGEFVPALFRVSEWLCIKIQE